MKKVTKLLTAAGAAAAAGTAAYVGVMFSLFTKRSSPVLNMAIKSKITVEKESPECKMMLEGRKSLKALELETLEITSYDGLKLKAHWYPAENARFTLVMVHGWHSAYWIDFAAIYDYLHELGCSLLMLDQRGCGESQGQYLSYGIKERFDIKDWANKAIELSDCPVFLYGVSMGAATSLMATGLELNERVKGVIADCGFTSPKDIIKTVIKHDGLPAPEATLAGADAVCKALAGYSYSDYSTIEALEKNKLPVLFIHGTADDFVPHSMTMDNYKACTAPKELLLVPGAGHAMSCAKAPGAYRMAVKNFMEKYGD